MPGYDETRIAQLEERLAVGPVLGRESAFSELEMLADLYMQADSYTPALQTIERLLRLPETRALSPPRRASLESKGISCRLLQGDAQGALAHCREVLLAEQAIEHLGVRCRLHLQCGEALFRLGRVEDCAGEANEALALADRCGDLSLVAWALNTLGRIAYRRGDLESARDHYEQALALYRRTGDQVAAAFVRNNLGLVHKTVCEWDAAATHLRAALDIQRQHGRFAETLAPLFNLGIVYQKSGNWKEAADCYTEAERVCAQIGDEMRRAHVAIGLGTIARLERRFTDAQALLEEALARARAQDAWREQTLALEFLGELDADCGRFEQALGCYQEALVLAERTAPEGDLVVEVERRRAEALLALGRLDAAEASCQRASRLARLIEDHFEFAVAERVAGSIAWARGRHEEAFVSWRLAASQLEACNERFELGRTYLEMGTRSKDTVQARRFLYRAGTLFAGLPIPYWLERSEAELQLVLGPAESVPGRPVPLPGRRHRAPGLVACSHAMLQVESLARRAAVTDLSVLVTGETGTGKELVARTIHALSARASRPFLAVNCGAVRAELALSQLFGHRKGAYTGAHADSAGFVEAAHGGTLLLDEVGELPPDVQVTLLRFLESGEYMRLGESQVRRADVRIIAATNRDLRGAGDRDRPFRRDLLFRLDEIEIRVPSLRDRREDIMPLAHHFLAFYGGMEGPRLSPAAESVLASHPWPGNVRELENLMKRVAALHGGGEEVSAEALLPFMGNSGSTMTTGDRPAAAADPAGERAAILAAYADARGNKSRVAERLGISRKTLYARLKRLGLYLP